MALGLERPEQALVGECEAMRALRRELAALAPLDTTVLIAGETGSGKGVAARALHALSPRRLGPFVHADCASLPRTLFESELFGHERGAFTGALARHAGRFERARGGTLFLDEIGELEPAPQAALLHVLQERSYERVGGSAPLCMSARVVAATSRDLRAEVRAGRFRPELYFRLDVGRLRLPPLRERPGDLPLLARALLARLEARLRLAPPRLGDAALARLAAHAWPGNVRELENALERLAIRCAGRLATEGDVAAVLDDGGAAPLAAAPVPEPAAAPPPLSAVLRACGGNVARAARELGLPRTTLRRRLARGQQPRQLGEHEVQREPRQQRLVEEGEARVGHLVEQPAAGPGAEHHEDREQRQRGREGEEGEAGRAEDREFGEMPERLAGRHAADHCLAREAEVQEERRDQRPGGADRGVEQADDAAEREEAQAQRDPLRVRAEQQQARRPGGRQHEDADQRARQRGGELLRDGEADEAHRQERQRVPEGDAALDVPALDPAARGVGDELHRAVQRNRDQRLVEEQHHRQQGHAAGQSQHAGEQRGGEGGGAEDGELERLQARRYLIAPR
jgi:transcriptional regulator with AAA-type ATPase domain